MPHSNNGRRFRFAGFLFGLTAGAWAGLLVLRVLGIISTSYVLLLSPIWILVAAFVASLIGVVSLAILLSALAEILDREPQEQAGYFD